MRVPLAWLRELAPTDLAADELAEVLTRRGVKVEGVLHPWAGLEDVRVVRVLEVRDHPDSDKLCVTRVQHGAGEIELVVGVRNMVPGDLVPWAAPGSRVPVLEDPLGAREIRGVVSNGMLCSPRELAIGQEHTGILVLDPGGFDVGDDLKAVLSLGDPVLDIEVEPNRPDFLSILGVAREAAAATDVPLTMPDITIAESAEQAEGVATVGIVNADRCPRYVARVIRGIGQGRTPLVAQARLSAAGMRPISAVVDATNYAMLELGQPLHAFDVARLEGPGIVVRTAEEGELLRTLDDVERTLSPDDLLICDVARPVAIAGVMGGATSEVSERTSDVLLESASFTRTGILRTARRLDLHTEASHRFERGVDREATDLGASRGAQLIARWAGGEVLAGAAATGTVEPRRWISMRPSRAGQLLGFEVSDATATEVFDELTMVWRHEGDAVAVEVPGYRVDIDREVDLIEEVARVVGYDHVGSHLPRSAHPGGLPEGFAFAWRVKDALVAAGLREIRPVPFVSAADIELTGDADAVVVANPLRAEEGYMRTRLLPGLVRAVARNRAAGVRSVALFEVGTVFRLADPTDERRMIGFVLNGEAAQGWSQPDRPFDALDARGVLEELFETLGVNGWSIEDGLEGPFHPGRSAWVTIDGARAGTIGELHPRVAADLDIEGRIAVVELEFDTVRAASAGTFRYRDVPRFPPVRRDLAFVVPIDAPAGAVTDELRRAGGELLDRAALFDVYTGDAVPEGTRSLAFAVDLRAPDRTLTDDEADDVVGAIVEALAARFGAVLRSGSD